jgi:hypothetical protein
METLNALSQHAAFHHGGVKFFEFVRIQNRQNYIFGLGFPGRRPAGRGL